MEKWILPISVTAILSLIGYFIRLWRSEVERRITVVDEYIEAHDKEDALKFSDIERRLSALEITAAKTFHLSSTVESVERRLEDGNRKFSLVSDRLMRLETLREGDKK